MNLKSVKIGNYITDNNVFAAPLAGYTNAVFRQSFQDMGAGLTFTEMVSAKGLCYNSENTRSLLYVTEEYKGVKACQIFGSDPYYMRKACESDDLAPFEIIDINMGCPVPKIFKNGEGSALMGNIPLAEKLISECKKSGKIITVKFRTGINKKEKIAVEFAKACEGAGADMITIHGRTREDYYSGDVDYEQIAAAKKAVNIPVIANGGIFSVADADVLINNTGADGVALGRGAIFTPWLFAELTGREMPDIKNMIKCQIARTKELYGERFACVFMRKMVAFFIKGQSGASAIKNELFACPDTESVLKIVEKLNF